MVKWETPETNRRAWRKKLIDWTQSDNDPAEQPSSFWCSYFCHECGNGIKESVYNDNNGLCGRCKRKENGL